ncbi:MAG: YciI family protein [Kofleriaceae bacterium]
MQYLLLIYDAEKNLAAMPETEYARLMSDYNTFSGELARSGKLVGGNRLHDVAKATTVRVREGKPQLTDGPFAETREQLGGYYLVEAKDLDEACAIAARIPSAKFGSIEVRPVHGM